MQTGDLLSVLAPRGATATLMVPGEGPTEPVVTLDAERYRALSAQGRGVVPVEVRSDSLPRNRQWQHFGASAPGVVYLKLTWGQKQALVRVQVAERPVVPRGTQLVWSEARQQDTIHLTQFDTLTLDLPGEPGDGWQITMQSGKSVLRSVAAAEGVVAGRVLLRVDVKPGAPEDVLSIQRQGRELFRFSVRPRPVPAC